MKQDIRFRFNEVYASVFNTDAYEIDIVGGRSRGGSHFCTDYFLFLITTSKYFRGYFMRLIHTDIKNSLYQDFKDRIEEKEEEQGIKLLDKFHFNDHEMSIVYLPNGNKINSKGFKKSSGNRTAKMKSIAGATHIIIEEFEEVGDEDYRKLSDSLRTTKVEKMQILRIWNMPQKSHWVLERYYDLIPNEEAEELQLKLGINAEVYYNAIPKGIENHLSIFSDYTNNLRNVNKVTRKRFENYKNNKRTIGHYLTDIKGLVSSGAKGQIFTDWKLFKELPDDTYFYTVYGLDWGGNDPHAIIKCDFDKKQRRVYLTEILYKPEILNSDLIKLVKQVNPNNHEVVCDSARKDKRFELSDAGINVIKADKTKINDDFRKDVIDMAKEYVTYVHEDSENLIHELQNFKWALNPTTKEPIDKPEDKNNHLQDARFYATRYYHTNYSYQYNDTN